MASPRGPRSRCFRPKTRVHTRLPAIELFSSPINFNTERASGLSTDRPRMRKNFIKRHRDARVTKALAKITAFSDRRKRHAVRRRGGWARAARLRAYVAIDSSDYRVSAKLRDIRREKRLLPSFAWFLPKETGARYNVLRAESLALRWTRGIVGSSRR